MQLRPATRAPAGRAPRALPAAVVAADAGRCSRVRAVLTGWRLEQAESPGEVLSAVRSGRADLVLAWAGSDGLKIVARLRTDPATADVPVILLGTAEEREACLKGLEVGADDFLLEPFDGGELAGRAAARLRAARERRRAAEREGELRVEARRAAAALERSRRAEEALRESEERFRLASEAISGLVYDWDVRRDETRRSRGLFGLLGYRPEEASQEVGWWTRQVHPEDWERASRDIYSSIAAGERFFSTEYRVRHRQGHWVHVWDRGLIVRDESGRPVRVVGSTVDVSDRKRAEDELKASSEAKDRFLATLSHELRTPLMPVLALVSSLQEDERIPADLRGHLVLIRRNVELEARLIDDLLDLTRIARDKLELERHITDVGEVLAHALRTAEGELAARGLRLVRDLPEESLLAWADPPRLTQVFSNLLQNAAKFTPAGGTIAVRARLEPGGDLRVEVEDSGIGIEPHVLPRIFGAFEQGDRRITRRFGGLGLGLAVSRAIVRLHGGDLTAFSEGAGRGSAFTVRLPAGAPEIGPAEAPGPAPEVEEPRHLRLLLVEDHADTAQAMAELLRALGHEVAVAGSVAAALEITERRGDRFDLVISDVGLPDGSGLELMRELAGRHGLRGIALSGYGMDDDVRRSREAGFATHLTKPVSFQALLEAIQHAACQG